VVRLLLDKRVNVNAQTEDSRWTPLHSAISKGHVDVVRLLLEKGANVNAQKKVGLTALHSGVECGHIDVVRLLLEKREIVEAKDKDGLCPLALARAKCERLELMNDTKRSERLAVVLPLLEDWGLIKHLGEIYRVWPGFEIGLKQGTYPNSKT